MQPTDLRIGNLIRSENWNTTAKIQGIEIFKNHFELKVKGFIHKCEKGEYCDFKPIPITEELVKSIRKTKFKLDTNLGKHYLKNGFEISFNKDGSLIYVFHKNDRLSHIKHVHELQNLYHALTNSELVFSEA